MASVPVEVLYGVYLGLLLGVIPVLVSWSLGFLFRYVTGVTIPGLAVVGLAALVAGASGGLLALGDPTLIASENRIRLTVGLLVVLMASLYAHAMGDRLGADLPKRVTLRGIAERTLSADVVELVGTRGQVRVRVVGEVGDVEGYPPLPPELRAEIRDRTETFPADLPLVEIERRFGESLRSDHDLAEVSVRLDERARASVAAAPPVGALSKRVGTGRRAVSVRALAPAGVDVGDEVRLTADGGRYEATVLGVRSTTERATAAPAGDLTDGETGSETSPPTAAPGSEALVTVAVGPGDVRPLLCGDVERLAVRSRGSRREFELVSLLRRTGSVVRAAVVGSGGPLDGRTLGEAAVRDEFGVAVLVVRGADGARQVAPRGDRRLAGGDELLVVGERAAVDRFREAVA
jgi:hypothetical protein